MNKITVTKQGCYLTPFQKKLLLKQLQTDLRPEYRRRIQIMLLADEGKSQSQICNQLDCPPVTARYWICMAQAGKAHQWNERSLGRPKVVHDQFKLRLREIANQSPRDYGYPFQRWTGHWLSKHMGKEFGIEVSERHINRLLKEMGLSTRRKSGAKSAETASLDAMNIQIQDLPKSDSSNDGWELNLLKLSSSQINQ